MLRLIVGVNVGLVGDSQEIRISRVAINCVEGRELFMPNSFLNLYRE